MKYHPSNNPLHTALVLALLAISPSVYAADIVAATSATEPTLSIAKFAGDRAGAISYTFDDGYLGHYTVAAPLLEKYGFRGTFGVIAHKTFDDPETAEKTVAGTNKVRKVTWKEWRELAARGHEIANHGYDHRLLNSMNDEQRELEVNEARRVITEKVARPLTFIYPGNQRNPQVREFVLRHHIASRDSSWGVGGASFTVEKTNSMVDGLIADHACKVVMAHAVAEAGFAAISKEDLEKHLKYVSTLKDRIWVDTFANVSKYILERDAARLAIATAQENRVKFTLSCPLDRQLYSCPLTCVVETGSSSLAAGSIRCVQGEKAVPATIAGTRLLVDVVPGSGAVTVEWNAGPQPAR